MNYKNNIDEILEDIESIVSKRTVIRDFSVAESMLKSRYCFKDEKCYLDIVDRMLSVLPQEDYRTRFLRSAMKHRWVLGATPELSNLGTVDKSNVMDIGRGLPISCFVTKVLDDMGSIIGNFRDIAVLGSLGGGVGIDFSDVAGLGEKIKNGTTAGIIPFVQVHNALTIAISQGSLRRASFVVKSKIGHPDYFEFINVRNPNGGDANRKALKMHHTIEFDDEFMESVLLDTETKFKEVRNGEEIGSYPSFDLLTQYLDINTETGEPFALFSGNTKRNRSDVYRLNDIHVTSSNLCFTGDMMLLTDKGYKSFFDLFNEGGEINVISDIRADNAESLNNANEFDMNSYIPNQNFSKMLSDTDKKGREYIQRKEVVTRKASKVQLTQKDAKIFRVTLANGTILKCTEDHKFYVFRDRKRLLKIPLKEVLLTDNVFLQSATGSFGTSGSYEEGYLLGSMFGDGYFMTKEQANEKDLKYKCDNARFKFWNEEKSYLEKIDSFVNKLCKDLDIEKPVPRVFVYNDNNITEYNSRELALYFKNKYNILSKKDVDFIYSLSEKAFIGFFQGFMDADGSGYKTVYEKSTGKFTYGVQVVQTNEKLLQIIQTMLQNFGITSNIHKNSEGGTFIDRRMDKDYNCNDRFRLDITQKSVALIQEMFGSVFLIDRKEEKLSVYKNERNKLFETDIFKANQNMTKIKSIDFIGREDVYDCTQYDTHSLIVNGVAVGNCMEILLEHTTDEIAVCCLASYNLEFFDEYVQYLDLLVESTAFFLHHVLEETYKLCDIISIRKPEYKDTLTKVKKAIRDDHSIGMGVMGYHTGMQKRGIAFESPMSVGYTKNIFTKIRKSADMVNEKLGHEFGSCTKASRVGLVRCFSNMIAVAPTSSISIIAGIPSPGIDPDLAVCYNLQQEEGANEIRNPYFAEILKAYAEERGLSETWIEDQWRFIRLDRGSVQNLEWLDENIKLVYKTAFEIDQNYVVELAALRQESIDQSQSLNLWFRADCHKKELFNIFVKAWKLGCKTIYYRRMRQTLSTNSGNESLNDVTKQEDHKYQECVNCQ